MIENNDFTFDISLNAALIKNYLVTTNDFVLQGSHLLGKVRRDAKKETVVRNLHEAITRCENIRFMSKQMETSAIDTIISLVQNTLSLLLEKLDEKNKPVVCILAPLFNTDNIADGYIRRIKNVDELIPSSAFRMYIYSNPCTPWPSIELVDDNHAILTYNDSQDISEIFALIAHHSTLIYCHSIHRFDAPLLENCNKEIILDFHGAVPEETLCLFEDPDKAHAYDKIERDAVSKCSTIIAVTNSMVKHIKTKYPVESEHCNFIVLPILDMNMQHLNSAHAPISHKGSSPRFVYAGGTQKWQLIDEMIQAISSQPALGYYQFFVPNPNDFGSHWNNYPKPNDMSIETKMPHELMNEYRQCDYGFILRDSSTVNKVACPTKLIEYLANGVVPIVKSPNIGDFYEDGYAYVTLDNFIAGNLPSQQQYRSMVERNFEVLESQSCRFIQGRLSLERLFSSYCNSSNN